MVQWIQQSLELSTRFQFVGTNYLRYRGIVQPESITDVHELVAYDIPIDNAVFGSLAYSHAHTRHELAQFIENLHHAKYLSCRQMYHQDTTEAMLSSFMRHQPKPSRLRSLDISNYPCGDNRSDRLSEWIWLHNGLFGEDAQHQITNLTLIIDRQATEINWIAEQVRAHGAVRSELFIAEVVDEYAAREPPTHDKWVQIPHNHPIQVHVSDDWRDHALRFDDDDQLVFRVLRDNPRSSFIDILVPGYGRCWIERSDATTIVEKPLTPWRFDHHSIHAMEFVVEVVDRQERDAVAAFLGLVGTPIRSLSFRRWFSPDSEGPEGLTYVMLASVVHSCPYLSSLSLHGVPFASVDALFDVYVNDSCRLCAINLGDNHSSTSPT